MKINVDLKKFTLPFLILILFIGGFVFTDLINSGQGDDGGYTDEVFQELRTHSLTVVRVVDGDTIEVDDNGVLVKFRLLGVDTPETVHPEKPVECFGKEAKEKMVELIEGKEIYFNFDPSQDPADKYGRNLVYIWRKNDDLFVNKYLLEEGYANFFENQVPIYFDKEFRSAEKFAKEGGRGLWGEVCAD